MTNIEEENKDSLNPDYTKWQVLENAQEHRDTDATTTETEREKDNDGKWDILLQRKRTYEKGELDFLVEKSVMSREKVDLIYQLAVSPQECNFESAGNIGAWHEILGDIRSSALNRLDRGETGSVTMGINNGEDESWSVDEENGKYKLTRFGHHFATGDPISAEFPDARDVPELKPEVAEKMTECLSLAMSNGGEHSQEELKQLVENLDSLGRLQTLSGVRDDLIHQLKNGHQLDRLSRTVEDYREEQRREIIRQEKETEQRMMNERLDKARAALAASGFSEEEISKLVKENTF